MPTAAEMRERLQKAVKVARVGPDGVSVETDLAVLERQLAVAEAQEAVSAGTTTVRRVVVNVSSGIC